MTSEAFIVSSRPDGSLFVHLDGISHDARKVATILGLPSIHLHSLRHFAATELISSGISAHDTAEMLGHVDPPLTLRVYSHANADRQLAAVEILSAALKPRPW